MASPLGLRRAILATLVGPILSAAVAEADTRAWTMCTPGTFRSCHSVQVGWTKYTDPTTGRQRTDVVVAVRNLQGTGFGGENVVEAALTAVVLTTTNYGAFPQSPFASVTTAGGARWSGLSATVGSGMITFPDGSRAGAVSLLPAVPPGFPWNGGVYGCGSGNLALYIFAQTCAEGSAIAFSLTMEGWLDVTDVGITATALQPNGHGGFAPSGSACSATAGDWFAEGCDVVNREFTTTVAPEPVSVALVATGLLGIGGARWRRRRRDGGA